MINNEKQLAVALMGEDRPVQLYKSLESRVPNIKCLSAGAWSSATALLLTSSFFWDGNNRMKPGLRVGLPTVLDVCGEKVE